MDDSTDDIVKGVITSDPASSVPEGAKLHFNSIPITTNFEGVTTSIKNWRYFEGIILSISFADEHAHYVQGSAVIIAPGIALCASHVIEPHLADLLEGRKATLCHGLASHGVFLWNIRKVTPVDKTDITILGLELASSFPPDNKFNMTCITTRTPKIGEELLLCGFRAGDDKFLIEDRSSIEIAGEIRISRGKVTNQYSQGRDSSMITWPVVEVSCPSRGGMSGGPVFDASGSLIGLICSSVEISEDEGISYVSLLWPALTAQFEPAWLKGVMPSKSSLLDLDRRLCNIIRPEAISKTLFDDGTQSNKYEHWE